MNVFTDFHHESLFDSFILLFEKRFDGHVFRPIGMEWFSNGYWHINNLEVTAVQFLQPGSIPIDGTPPLNNSLEHTMTYNQFFETDIDIVIASLPQHIEPFKNLCFKHPSKPKLIYQIGNKWHVPNGVNNIMASAVVPMPYDINYVVYHQEFDLNIFKPDDLSIMPPNNIYSFINILQDTYDYPTFEELERQMQDYSFKSYGGQCRDGCIAMGEHLAKEMRQAKFIWHVKHTGDGFGHILHNAFAVGRPIITKMQYNYGTLAEPLLLDGQTCILIDELPIDKIVEKLHYYSDEVRYKQLCQNAYQRFKEVVDFDKEAIEIEAFIKRLI